MPLDILCIDLDLLDLLLLVLGLVSVLGIGPNLN